MSKDGLTMSVTAVVPAFNEEHNISTVLGVLHHTPRLDEILVVDDGSTDQTADVVARWREKDSRIVLLPLAQNQGKGNAMLKGVEAAKHSLLVFLDADLKGLEPHHVNQLIDPVEKGGVDMTIARFENGRVQTSLMHRILPFLSGQRCMKASTFHALFDQNNKNWSVETAFNLHAWWYGYQTQYISWDGITHEMRPEKRKGLSGYISHVKMWWQIGSYVATFFGRRLLAQLQPQLRPQPSLLERLSRRQANKAWPKQHQ